ncbi:MAG: peptidyl-prolyl cis-trans isomerase [Ignavibacteriales bacterium]|nr:peptidyl-prolyl cis-trans isomerase [Ignavibacteriales bacterium]MBI3788843.1 peptidyl-prolyl cis-trans isomerase [Ignavibacteriales bacterium]
MKNSNIMLAVCMLVVLAGCQKRESTQTPVARMDDQTLTLEKVRAEFGSSRSISSAQLHEYISRWVNNEMLYREALRRGMDKKETVVARVEEVRRQLVINALLDEEIYGDKTLESTPQEISEYYNTHQKEFVVPQHVALLSFVLFRDRDAANTFRTNIVSGASWDATLKQLLADPRQSTFVSLHVDSSYYTESTLLPVELWRVAAAAIPKEPSFPVKMNDGYYIVLVWKHTGQGQVADLKYAEKEIRGRLTMERRQHLMDSLMENLRAKHSVEILVNATGGDSTSIKPVE